MDRAGSMKAAVREQYGSPDVVEVRDVERPTPVDDQVLVHVRAASVNRADLDGLLPRPAFSRLFLGLRTPRNHRLGIDVAGVVETVGPKATAFKPGDAVFGDLFGFGQGAFAEYACAPDRAFAAVPTGMSFGDAAALPHSAILALQGLRLRNGRTVRPGDRVLIDGASGNVGPFAVQIAKARGAEVTGVCSAAKVDFVRSLGADHVIDYTKVDYRTTGQRYDWILAAEARGSLLRHRRALRPKGVYVALGAPTTASFFALLFGSLVAKVAGTQMGLMLWWKPFHPADVATLKALLASGQVRPVIDRRYPLAEIADALRFVDAGQARGKVVIIA